MQKYKPSLKGDIQELIRVNENISMKIDSLSPKRESIRLKIESLNSEIYDLDDKILSLTKESEKITGFIADMNSNDCNCYKISKDGEITYYKMVPGKVNKE